MNDVSSPPAVPPDAMHSYLHRDVGEQRGDVKDMTLSSLSCTSLAI